MQTPISQKLVGACVCYRFFLKKSHFNKDLKHKRKTNNRILWIPIFLFAETECGHCALQNIYNFVADFAILDCSRSIRYVRGRFVHLAKDNLLCITCDSNIRVVRDNYYLTPLFGCTYARNQFPIDRLVVKVIFRLIHDNWHITLAKCEVENQENNSTLSRRKLL